MRRLASIDIGSQTIRLLAADMAADGVLVPVLKDRAIIRLGEGVARKTVSSTGSNAKGCSLQSGFQP